MTQTTLINDIYGVVGSQGEITDLNIDGKSLGLVRATTSPGGVVRNSLGELIWRPGWNQFVNALPQTVLRVADQEGAPLYTSVSYTGLGASEVDLDMADPATALPMLKLVMPAGGANQYQSVKWEDIEPIEMAAGDVWIVTAYVPRDISDAAVGLLLSPDASVGSRYRLFTWMGTQPGRLSRGWNVLICLNEELRIDGTTYGVVGTTPQLGWEAYGSAATPGMAVRSITVRAAKTAAPAEPVPIHIGSVSIARAGWCKGSVIWGADDIWQSFADIAIPIIESYGWKTTLSPVSSRPVASTNFAPVGVVRELAQNGHEIWGHTRTHANMSTEVNKDRELIPSAQFWRANGIPSAAEYLSWPFGAFSESAIASAKSAGYKFARGVYGSSTPWIPALNRYTYPAIGIETFTNSWQADALLHGAILRGQATFTYIHEAVAGGAGLDVRPGDSQFYGDHLRRWCDLVASHEQAGRCIVTTAADYFRLCGIDPADPNFAE